MDNGTVCVFGGTGFLGRRIVRRLRAHGHSVRVASRHPARSRSLFANEDRIELLRADVEDEQSVAAALADTHGAVNAVSLYVERGGRTFRSVHVRAAERLAAQARRAGVRHFAHVSGIGADARSDSPYIRSRGEGVLAVQAAFPGAKIVRPAVMFGPDDAFLTTTVKLLKTLPMFPLFGDGRTRLQPVSVEDVSEAVVRAFAHDAAVYELGGPRIYEYEDLLRTIARRAGVRPVLVPVLFPLWHALGRLAELLPSPPLTRSQVELMRSDTVVSPDMPGLAALGISPQPLEEVLELILSQQPAGA